MPKKKTPKQIVSLVDFIKNYISRNTKEQKIPEGYTSFKDTLKMIGCTRRGWDRIFKGLKELNKIEYIKLSRVDNGKLKSLSFYKISPELIKEFKK